MQGYTNASATQSIRLTDISVTFSAQTTPTYTNFPNRASVSVTGCTSNKQATVTYNSTEALSGNYAPWCETYDGGVYLYSKVAGTITVATIVIDQVSNFFNLESTPTQNSGNPISSGGVFTNCVRTTGDQTITGTKTFSAAINHGANASVFAETGATENDIQLEARNGTYKGQLKLITDNTGTTKLWLFKYDGAWSGTEITESGVGLVHTSRDETIGGTKTFTGGISNSNCFLVNPGADTNYREGIRIARATDNWGLIMLGTTAGSTSGMSGWIIGNDPSNRFLVSGKDATYSTGLFYGTYDSSTATHTLNVPHNFRVGGQQVVQLCNSSYNNTPGQWGVLTPANGYTGVLSIWRNAGAIEIAEKSQAFYLQLDGCMYQRNNYRVLDEGDITISSSAPSGGSNGNIWIQY